MTNAAKPNTWLVNQVINVILPNFICNHYKNKENAALLCLS